MNFGGMEKPIQRKETKNVTFLIFVTFLTVYVFLYERKICEVCVPIAAGLGVFLLLRIYLFIQELMVQRYNFKVSLTLELLIQPSSTSSGFQNGHGFWIRFVVFALALCQLSPKDSWFENKIDIVVLLVLITLGIHLEWHDCALLESHRLAKPSSYSGGSGMAFSFYYGYLKLIAPGLVGRIEHFRDNEGIHDFQIPKKKLYILLPSSSFIFDKLEGYQQLTKTKDLKIEHVADKFNSHKQDRGLVRGRTYKNTMYIVEYSEKEKYYILLEGATPLKTFYETCKEHKQFEKNKDQVISSFYYTLKKLIRENKETKDVVKLIYYNDERDVTIPDIVKERILKKNGKKKEKERKEK